jgi:hypothetical protein
MRAATHPAEANKTLAIRNSDQSFVQTPSFLNSLFSIQFFAETIPASFFVIQAVQATGRFAATVGGRRSGHPDDCITDAAQT